MKNPLKSRIVSFAQVILLSAGSLGLIASCGGGGGGDPGPPAVPTGYYSGSGTVKQADNSTAYPISDFQALVNGNRIMLMSVSQMLVYDMQNISIRGSSYSATINVYQNGAYLVQTTVTGTITEGVSLTGTLKGSGVANGTFSVSYNSTNNANTASLTIIGGASYRGELNSGIDPLTFDIDVNGNVLSSMFSNGVKIAGCEIVNGSSLAPVANENLYVVTFVLNNCTDTTVNGTYTGLASIFDTTEGANALMPTVFTNGSYTGTADFHL